MDQVCVHSTCTQRSRSPHTGDTTRRARRTASRTTRAKEDMPLRGASRQRCPFCTRDHGKFTIGRGTAWRVARTRFAHALALQRDSTPHRLCPQKTETAGHVASAAVQQRTAVQKASAKSQTAAAVFPRCSLLGEEEEPRLQVRMARTAAGERVRAACWVCALVQQPLLLLLLPSKDARASAGIRLRLRISTCVYACLSVYRDIICGFLAGCNRLRSPVANRDRGCHDDAF
jgi:hypothetical protein